MAFESITTKQLQAFFTEKFGKDYQKTHVHRICKFFLKQLEIKYDKVDPITAVKETWYKVKPLIEDWVN